MAEDSGDKKQSLSEASDGEYDPHFAPIISLPEVVIPTNEEDEEVILKLRARLYRFDRTDFVPEWKERGTGEVKLLKHSGNKTVRLVMRRDKTLKVCANHFITPLLELKPKQGLDKAFIYNVPADFSDGEIKSECLVIKFGNVDYASQFKKVFLESQEYVLKECKLYNGEADELTSSEEEEVDSGAEEDEEKENREDESNKVKEDVCEEVAEKLKELDVAEKIKN